MIIVSGSIAYDTIVSTAWKFVDNRRGDEKHYSYSLFSPRMVRQSWWTWHNIAYTLWLLGFKNETLLVWSVGIDFIAEERLKNHISYDHVLTNSKNLTACATIINDDDNNQIIAFHPWAMSSWLHTLPNQNCKYSIIAPNDKQIMISHAKAAKAMWSVVFFDPGQALWLFTKEDLSDIFSVVDYLICNDEEALSIATLFSIDVSNISTICKNFIITQWANWISYCDSGKNWFIKSFLVDQVVDTTGAWDAFRGWMLAGLMAWESLETALWYWSIVWALAVTHQWTMNHEISIADLKDKYNLRKTSELL